MSAPLAIMPGRRAARAVFRCDASAEIGGGHLRRCLTLAEELATRGWRIAFAMRERSFSEVPAAELATARRIVLLGGAGEEAREIAARLDDEPADLVVVDHYGHDHRFETQCRCFAARIAVIDDLANRRHDADLLLDQTFGRAPIDYAGLVPASCRLLCGSRYALLREPFARMRQAALARRRAGGTVQRILVTMGATDDSDLTETVLDALEAVAKKAIAAPVVDVVLGASAPHLASVADRLATGACSGRLHVGVAGEAMARLMTAADLSIGAAGTTSWERCCLALPCLVLVAAENQATIAAHLAEVGACRLVGEAATVTTHHIAAALAAVWRNGAARSAMAEVAASVCDGEGAARVVAAIESMLAPTSERMRKSAP
jgi:UDP-2,4-diacetamido-2,4,6-trideoxy-beta-L-altropyranose hydrolase